MSVVVLGSTREQALAAVMGPRVRAGEAIAVATLVDVEGSAPFSPGSMMFVDGDGAIEGSITGGCVESAVASEALELLADGSRPPRLIRYGVSDELAGTAGLMCGGTVEVLVQRLGDGARDVVCALLAAMDADVPTASATLLDGPGAGSRMLVQPSGVTGGLHAPALLTDNVAAEAAALLAAGQSTVRRFGADGSTLGEDVRVQIAVRAQRPKMVIVGAVDFTVALAAIARPVGYDVVVCDPRTAFLGSPRLTGLARTLAAWPQEALGHLDLGPSDAVLVFTHDARLDVPALAAALASPAGFVGALGSRRTTAERTRRLQEAGVGRSEIDRVHAPCGLDIGASTPEETAVAVLAEIIAARKGRTGGPLTTAVGPIRATDAAVGR